MNPKEKRNRKENIIKIILFSIIFLLALFVIKGINADLGVGDIINAIESAVNDNLKEWVEDAYNVARENIAKDTALPKVDLQVIGTTYQKTALNFAAIAYGFIEMDPKDLIFNWCEDKEPYYPESLQPGAKDITYQPYLAGGDLSNKYGTIINPACPEEIKRLIPPGSPIFASVGLIRSTNIDTDSDGIDDEWEVRYFGSTEACAPDDDPDKDGAQYPVALSSFIDINTARNILNSGQSQIDSINADLTNARNSYINSACDYDINILTTEERTRLTDLQAKKAAGTITSQEQTELDNLERTARTKTADQCYITGGAQCPSLSGDCGTWLQTISIAPGQIASLQNQINDSQNLVNAWDKANAYFSDYLSGSNTIGAPYAAGEVTGDGKFTNYEEYVFGTNPIVADTDEDGYLDELDIIGYGQSRIDFPGLEDIKYKYKIHVRAFGETVRYDSDPETQGQYKYYIAEKGAEAGLAGGPQLEVYLSVDPLHPTIKNTEAQDGRVIANASISNIKQDKATLYYRWYLDAAPGDSPDDEGYGKSSFGFNVTKSPCEFHTVRVEVVEESTERTAMAEQGIEIAPSLNIGLEYLGRNPDPKFTTGVNDPTGTSINPASPDFKGFRFGDMVKITATPDDLSACGINVSDLIFEWTLDGMKDEEHMENYIGKGKNTFEFTITKSMAEKHIIGIKVFQTERKNPFIIYNFEMKVIGPEVEVPDLQTGVGVGLEAASLFTDTTSPTGKPVYYVNSGDQIKVIAQITGFQPTNELTWTWELNGETLQTITDMVDSTYLIFTAGDAGTIDRINVNIISDIDADGLRDEEVSGSVEINVVEDTDALIAMYTPDMERKGVPARMFAFVSDFLPRYFKNIYHIALTTVVICLIILFSYNLSHWKKPSKPLR